MAWVRSKKRKNKANNNRMQKYWTLCWRDAHSRIRTRGLGFCSGVDARRALKVFEGKLAAGEAVVRPTSVASSSGTRGAPTPTLSEYLDGVYLPVVRRDKAAKTAVTENTSGNALKAIMGHLRLDEVDFAVVDAYVSHRRELGRKSRTIILELRTLRHALRHAAACDLLDTVPEFPKIRDRDRAPHRFLTPEESVALLDELRPFDSQPHRVTRGHPPIIRDRLSYLAVLMALNTGARRGEILSREWCDLRWHQGPNGTLLITSKRRIGFRVKMGRERAVPLTRELRAELEALHRDLDQPKDGWIFPSRKGPERPRQTFWKALRQACKRAGLERIHPHGLRHTWASRLATAGVDRRTLMELGGWQEGRMLDEIYAHVTDDHKADVMDKMGLGATPESGIDR